MTNQIHFTALLSNFLLSMRLKLFKCVSFLGRHYVIISVLTVKVYRKYKNQSEQIKGKWRYNQWYVTQPDNHLYDSALPFILGIKSTTFFMFAFLTSFGTLESPLHHHCRYPNFPSSFSFSSHPPSFSCPFLEWHHRGSWGHAGRRGSPYLFWQLQVPGSGRANTKSIKEIMLGIVTMRTYKAPSKMAETCFVYSCFTKVSVEAHFICSLKVWSYSIRIFMWKDNFSKPFPYLIFNKITKSLKEK